MAKDWRAKFSSDRKDQESPAFQRSKQIESETKSQDESALNALLSGNFGDILPALGRTVSKQGEQLYKESQPGAKDMSATTNLALGFSPQGIAEQTGKGVSYLSKLLRPGKTGEEISKATQAATSGGASISAHDLITNMRKAAEDKFAPYGLENAIPEVKNAFGKIVKHVTGLDISPQTIAKMKEIPITGEINPSQVVKARQSLSNTFGYIPGTSNLEHKMANTMYDEITKAAKEITPGLSKADADYVKSLKIQETLKKLGPSLWKIIGGGALGGAALGEGYNLVKNVGSSSQDSNQ